MATESKTPAKADDSKAKTVAEDMNFRRIFNTTEEAGAYLNLCAESFKDFGDIPLASRGIDEEGNFDPTIYTDGMQVMVATLREAKKGVKAIVVTPIPSLTSLLADANGTSWIERIIQKELNHVAVRALREAADVSTVVDQMPTTRDAYISSARGDGGGIMETFNELYKAIGATMASAVAVWAKTKPVRGDLKRAMESKGFALEYFPALENRGEGKDSLFVVAMNLGINTAKKKGLDPTIFERWIETRNAKVFKAGDVEEDEDDLNIDSLTTSLLTEEGDAPSAPVETPVADTTPNTGDANATAATETGEPTVSGEQTPTT